MCSPSRCAPVAGREDADYEIVYGHRRHRACLELGLPVQAISEAVSDGELFSAMDRENRQRKDLSPWEQGQMYRRALDEGLYPSLRRLAEAIGADPGNVSKALTLARLPDAVIEAFPSPLQIQTNWGPALSAAVQKDPEGTMARARAAAARKLSARQVLEALTTQPPVVPYNGPETLTSADGKRSASLGVDAQGRTQVVFSKSAVGDARRDALRDCDPARFWADIRRVLYGTTGSCFSRFSCTPTCRLIKPSVSRARRSALPCVESPASERSHRAASSSRLADWSRALCTAKACGEQGSDTMRAEDRWSPGVARGARRAVDRRSGARAFGRSDRDGRRGLSMR